MKIKLLDAIREIRPDLEFDGSVDFALHGVLDSLDIVLLVDEIEATLGVEIEVSQINPDVFSSFVTLLAHLNESSQR